MDITIGQLKSAKDELECQILDLLQSFENVHGVSVASVDIMHSKIMGKRLVETQLVQVKVEL